MVLNAEHASPLLTADALAAAEQRHGGGGDNGGSKTVIACSKLVAESPNMVRKQSSGSGCLEIGSIRIGLAALVSISFFNVSGGPWGSEDIVSTGGPLVGCAGILLFTVFFCLPQCFYTSELCCAFPSNGGYAVWVREALGEFWAVQEVYWQWVSGVADAAVYPVLLCDTVLQLLHTNGDAVGRFELWLCRMVVTVLLSLPALVSFHTVPALLTALALATAAPILAFIVWGAFLFNPGVLLQVSKTPISVGKLLNIIFWNLEGWDGISTCTGQISEPREKLIPRALFLALGATSLQYVVVLLIAAGLDPVRHPWAEWKDGSLPSIVEGTMGPLMSGVLLLASGVGNSGMYLSEFMEDSFLLQGAAEIGIAPKVFARKIRLTGAPYMANGFQFAMVSLLVVFDFTDILVFDNFFSGMALALQFIAFFVLRAKQPDLPRPYRVPRWAFILFVPAGAFLAIMLYHCVLEAGKASVITILAFVIGTPYGLWVASREQESHKAGKRSALDELLEGG